MDTAMLPRRLVTALEEARKTAESATQRGKPIIPFVITASSGVLRFSRHPAAAMNAAMNYWETHKASESYLLICFDAVIEQHGQKADAIIVRCYQRSTAVWHVFGQPYRPKTWLKSYERIGDWIWLHREPV